MQKTLFFLAGFLTFLGALNAGFWGWFQFDFVAWFNHSSTSIAARSMYSVFGFSSIYLFIQLVGKKSYLKVK